jgi:hypothetical protein
VYLTSLLDRLHLTRACLPLLDGLTWRCGPSDNEEEVATLCVPEDDVVGVLLTVPEDGEVGGVVDLNCPCASCLYVAVLWPLRTPPPLACKPSVWHSRLPPPLAWIHDAARLPWPPLGCVAAQCPLHPRPPLAWEGSMRLLRSLSLLATGETSMWGISMWRRRSEPMRGMVGVDVYWGGELKVIDDLGRPTLAFITLSSPFGFFTTVSHSRTFSATPETEMGVSHLKRGDVPALSNSGLPSSTTTFYLCYGA